MANSFASASAPPRGASFLWVNLTRQARTALGESAGGAFNVHHVREPRQIPAAIASPGSQARGHAQARGQVSHLAKCASDLWETGDPAVFLLFPEFGK